MLVHELADLVQASLLHVLVLLLPGGLVEGRVVLVNAKELELIEDALRRCQHQGLLVAFCLQELCGGEAGRDHAVLGLVHDLWVRSVAELDAQCLELLDNAVSRIVRIVRQKEHPLVFLCQQHVHLVDDVVLQLPVLLAVLRVLDVRVLEVPQHTVAIEDVRVEAVEYAFVACSPVVPQRLQPIRHRWRRVGGPRVRRHGRQSARDAAMARMPCRHGLCEVLQHEDHLLRSDILRLSHRRQEPVQCLVHPLFRIHVHLSAGRDPLVILPSDLLDETAAEKIDDRAVGAQPPIDIVNQGDEALQNSVPVLFHGLLVRRSAQ
mmetsp:Transcript_22952/g.66405  ORF Transcript_22952/g.66405 Transcript_22952/m.66405 type:complete len:320 (-) Transcript_22952:54-1013(-)